MASRTRLVAYCLGHLSDRRSCGIGLRFYRTNYLNGHHQNLVNFRLSAILLRSFRIYQSSRCTSAFSNFFDRCIFL